MSYYFKLPIITDLTIGQQTALNETEAIAISGGPGTGKSVVSLWRHIRNYDIGTTKSLLLTYTKTLETYLATSARSENEEAGNAVNRTYWWTTHHRENYDEIIVDEAQDVEIGRYNTLKQYAGILSYGADDKQIVYPDKCTVEKDLITIFPNNRRYELFENFRNSYEIMQFVRGLFPNKLIPRTTMDTLLKEGKRGNKPILLVSNRNDEKQNKAIIDIINQFKSDTHNIAVLAPLKKHVLFYYELIKKAGLKCSKFINDDDELITIENIHITTFKSSKGTEYDTVIIPDFQRYHWNIANLTEAKITENDYYVAITRARRNLYLISNNELPFLEQSTYNKELL